MRIPYTKKELMGIVAVVLFFVVAQYYARQYADQLQTLVATDQRAVGMIAYGLVAIIAIVIAPVRSLPLVPIAAAIWGSFTTAVVTLVAWSIGAGIAFLLARTYGRRIIGKVVDARSMGKLEGIMGHRNVFASTLLLRMVVPVDILSYALGLFSTIKFIPYCVATTVGMIPFILFFSYAIVIPIYWQIVIAVGIVALVLTILRRGFKRI